MRCCARTAESRTGLALPPGALRFLEATSGLPIDKAMEISLGEKALHALRESLPRMVQSVLEGELASLRWVGTGR